MKKSVLAAIAAVLVLSSISNADLIWTDLNGIPLPESINLDIGGTIDIGIYSDGSPLSYDGISVGGDSSAFADIVDIQPLTDAGSGAVAEYTDIGSWWTIETGDAPVAGVHFLVTVSGNEIGQWTIEADSFEGAGDYDSLLINVIPEPMTVALLGLGGLFLRRRTA